MLLLIGAGLLIRSLERLATLNPGYDPSQLLALRVSLPGLLPANPQPDARLIVTAGEILRRVSQLPSIQSASISTDVPLGGESAVFYTAEVSQPCMLKLCPVPTSIVSRRTSSRHCERHLILGRPFTEDEVYNNAGVAIVTESLVQRFWSGRDPIRQAHQSRRPGVATALVDDHWSGA